jgi:flavin-dependent dehydrogenase
VQTRYDALIIGGGPAGGTAALLLARAGWRVALIERKAFPRRKVCGEYLSGTNLPLLRCLGLGDAFEEAAGPEARRVAVFSGAVSVSADLPRPRHGWGRALGREHLDTMVLQRATQAGAEIWQPWSAVALARRGEQVICRIKSQETQAEAELIAPLAIAAHGSWEPGSLPTHLGRAPVRADDLLGFKAHLRRTSLPRDLMPLLAFPGGYGGMVHSDGERVSLSCCIRRDRLARLQRGGSAGEAVLGHILESCRAAREVLADARIDGPWLAAGPIRPGVRLHLQQGIFPIGNLAGEAHPVVAEGISMAMQSAWLLVSRLQAWRAQGGDRTHLRQVGAAYGSAWRHMFAPRVYAAALIAHWAMRPRLVASAAPLLRGFPALLNWGARLSGKARSVVRS